MVYGTELFFALFNNLAIFIALVAVYGFLLGHFEKSSAVGRQAVCGLSFGLFAIGCMYAKIPVYEGVIVDQRNAIVALSGAFGGPVSAVVSAVMAGAYRLYLGGGGAVAGAVGVCLAATAGIGLHKVHDRLDSLGKSALGALLATLVILPGFLLVGDLQTGWSLLKAMALPYGTAIFLGIFLVGLLLNHEEHRQKAATALKESETRLHTILSNVGAFIFIKDTEYRYTYANSKVGELLGRDVQDILGKDDRAFFSAASVAEILRSDRRVIEGGETVTREETDLSGPDGPPRTYWTVKLPLRDNKGEIYGLCGISTDITERKRMETERLELEEALHQAQKMEAVGTLAGGIAHDFNNILGAVFGYTELSLAAKDLAPAHREHLQAILAAAERARDLVRQILTYSRKQEEQRHPVQLHLVVEDAMRLLRQTIPSTIDIQLDLDQDTGTVMADVTQIHQVVMNLCTNAYAAMKEAGGELSVRLEPVRVDPRTASRHLQLPEGVFALLTVKDTGIGINSDVVPRVFDPFFTTKETGEGTGMGLSVVQGIVRSHGGSVGIESRPGAGTTVRVYLPLAPAGTPGPATALPQAVRTTGDEHVLLVDDDPALVSLGEQQLRSLGYRVTAATSPREALAIFAAAPDDFDLLVTDQTMPEMTGDALAREAMGMRPGFPVVICTGYSDTIDADRARDLGARAFRMKPMNWTTLAETVRQVLDDVVQPGS